MSMAQNDRGSGGWDGPSSNLPAAQGAQEAAAAAAYVPGWNVPRSGFVSRNLGCVVLPAETLQSEP